jgi:hypothetical protein
MAGGPRKGFVVAFLGQGVAIANNHSAAETQDDMVAQAWAVPIFASHLAYGCSISG